MQKRYVLLWFVIPVVAGLLYPSVKGNPQFLEWLTIGLLIYVLFFSVVIHELCHGLAANWCGDPTAKHAGRLTLNPLSHVSLFGSILVPLVLYFICWIASEVIGRLHGGITLARKKQSPLP